MPPHALGDLPHQGQPEAALGTGGRQLGGDPVREHLLPHVARHPWPGVVDADRAGRLGRDQGQLDLSRARAPVLPRPAPSPGSAVMETASIALSMRLPTTVSTSRISSDPLPDVAVGHQPKRDAALVGERCKSQDEGREFRLADGRHQCLGQFLRGRRSGRSRTARPPRSAPVRRGHQGVRPVGELVRRARSVSARPRASSSRARASRTRSVLKGHDPAELMAVPGDRHPVATSTRSPCSTAGRCRSPRR